MTGREHGPSDPVRACTDGAGKGIRWDGSRYCLGCGLPESACEREWGRAFVARYGRERATRFVAFIESLNIDGVTESSSPDREGAE